MSYSNVICYFSFSALIEKLNNLNGSTTGRRQSAPDNNIHDDKPSKSHSSERSETGHSEKSVDDFTEEQLVAVKRFVLFSSNVVKR